MKLTFRELRGIGVLFRSPAIDLGAPSVNATVTLQVPFGRWLLMTNGPRVGPAILFWSLLVVLMVVAVALGRNRWTPLRGWHWALLFVGLSQVDVVAGLVFVGWLLALGHRAREDQQALGRAWFNLRQLVLVAWTLAALTILGVALYHGLLGPPEMQVKGNGSDPTLLRWFTDRTGSLLPNVSVVSVPLLVIPGRDAGVGPLDCLVAVVVAALGLGGVHPRRRLEEASTVAPTQARGAPPGARIPARASGVNHEELPFWITMGLAQSEVALRGSPRRCSGVRRGCMCRADATCRHAQRSPRRRFRTPLEYSERATRMQAAFNAPFVPHCKL